MRALLRRLILWALGGQQATFDPADLDRVTREG